MSHSKERKFKIEYLSDPEVFAINREKAHSGIRYVIMPDRADPETVINDGWEVACFHHFEDALRLAESGQEADFHAINVPGHLQLQGYGQIQYTNQMYPWDGREDIIPPQVPEENLTAVYRREICIGDFDGRMFLRFEGVESCVVLYVNGRFTGYSEDSFTPAEFDITDFLIPGKNVLTAVVAQFCSGSWLEDQDFWRFSGIFRDVKLIRIPAAHITDISIRALVSEDLSEGKLTICGEVQEGEIHAVLKRDGATVCNCVCYAVDGRFESSMTVVAPDLWSAEAPNLYRVEITLKVDGTERELFYEDVAFRRFELSGGKMLLNGKRLILYGVNRHEFHCDKGRAITSTDIENDIIALKRHHFNAVRTSHYPSHDAFYRLCNRYGLYVMDEVNLETHGTWMVMGCKAYGEKTIPDDKKVWRSAVLDRANSMYQRDKNYPCILMWSCGNEAFGGSILKEEADFFRRVDPSRIVHYEGIFQDNRYPGTSDIESRMYAKPQEIREYLENAPLRPLILCEYAHSMGNSFGNVSLYTELIDQYEMFQGGFVWEFKDQALRDSRGHLVTGGMFRKPDDGYFCGDGLLFADGSVSPKMEEAKWLFSPVRITCTDGAIQIINRNLFQDTGKYRFVWKLLRNGETVYNGEFEISVPPGESRRKQVSYQIEDGAESILECSALLKEDTLYAHAGYEVTFGQCVVRPFIPANNTDTAPIVPGDCNFGGKMDGSFALISRSSGKLISFENDRLELLHAAAKPEFWRAPTDNDIGANRDFEWAKWKTASLYQKCTGVWHETENHEIGSVIRLAQDIGECVVHYAFYRSGTIGIRAEMEIRGELPFFGLELQMPDEFSIIRWYGNTQREAYIDRQNGARIGIGESMVQQQYVPYLNPQECANKTLLRWLEVKNTAGQGIRITSDGLFEASVLPYTCHELESAEYGHTLPESNRTVIRLCKAQCGVGGDDAWGAPVHEAYRLRPNGKISVTFYLTAISS